MNQTGEPSKSSVKDLTLLRSFKKCGQQDLNLYALRHENLNLACLPISSCPHNQILLDSYFEKMPADESRHFNGAAYEARTRYLHLGKVALYRMS